MPFASGSAGSDGASPLYFVEARWSSLVAYRTGRPPAVEVTSFRGVGKTSRSEHGELHQWCWLPEAASATEARCPPEVLELADGIRIAEDEDLGEVEAYATHIANELAAVGDTVELRVRRMRQQVAVVTEGGVQHDDRLVVGVGLRVVRTTGDAPAAVYRSRTYCDVLGLLGDANALRTTAVTALEEAAAAPSVAVEGGRTTVLLGAGTAGSFFHEVCGHPLEGDVVSTGTSYLATRLGQHVAATDLTVVDDPTHRSSNARYRIDDEGCPARPVQVIADGVVADLLLDRRTARRLRREPNGHGRRLDFRFPALPRMTHTAVRPGRGTFDELIAPVARGVLAERLGLRHMDVATGEFSFYVLEGRRIERGALGPPLRPLVIRGNALDALAAIDAIGEDLEDFVPSGGGCGKLDQGPLFVSFGSPTVRIRELDVGPWI